MKIVVADRSWMFGLGVARAVERLLEHPVVSSVTSEEGLHRVLCDHGDTSFVFIEDAILGGDEEAIFGRVRRLAPDAAIGVLVGRTDRERVLKAIYFGATAILPKAADEETTLGTLRAFFGGQAAFPRALLDGGRGQDDTVRLREPADDDHAALTPREREVIGHLGTGKTVARIAAELELSPHTVRVHVTRIMKKLDLRDRSALIHYAVSRGTSGKAAGTA